MIFSETKLKGSFVIEPERIADERGYFERLFDEGEFKKNGIEFNILQSNISFNKKTGTLRGMHFQKMPKAEDKIVRCIKGSIFDVALDLRTDSPTFGLWHAETLTAENGKMFFIPKGFAHGFLTLVPDTEAEYFMSETFSPEHASGVRWDDSKFKIEWPFPPIVMSEKDKNWPLL